MILTAEQTKYVTITNASILASMKIHVQSMPFARLKTMPPGVLVLQDWLEIRTDTAKKLNATSTEIVTVPKLVYRTNALTLVLLTMFAPPLPFVK